MKDYHNVRLNLHPGAWQEWLRAMAGAEGDDPLFSKLPGLNSS